MDSRNHRDATGIYQKILWNLEGLRRKENKEQLLAGVLLLVLGLVGVLLVAVAVEAILRLGVTGRTILFWLIVAASAIGFGWLVGERLMKSLGLLKSSDNETLAVKTGDHFPSIKDRLLNLLQLHREKEEIKTLYSPELIDAAFVDLRDEVAALDFRGAITYERPRRLGKSFTFVVAASALLMVSFPSSLFEAAGRLAHFRQEFEIPPPIRFAIQPGNAEVVRGENVQLLIAVEGTPLDNISLLARQEGEVNYNQATLKRSPDGKFSYGMNAIKN